jgi:hypothetical protein
MIVSCYLRDDPRAAERQACKAATTSSSGNADWKIRILQKPWQ